MELKGYIISSLLVSLFIIAILQFGILTGNNYGKGDDFIDEEKVGFSDLQDQIEETNTQAENWESLFREDNPFLSDAGLILESIWGVVKLVWSAGTDLLNVIFQGAEKILHLPPMVTGVIITLFIVALVFGSWKVVKTGES
jgi:hypothetical protein